MIAVTAQKRIGKTQKATILRLLPFT
jgi:hypothetical protein